MEYKCIFRSRRAAVLSLQKVSHLHFKIMKQFQQNMLKNLPWTGSAVTWQSTQPKQTIHHLSSSPPESSATSPPPHPGAWLNLLMWPTRWASQLHGQIFLEKEILANPDGSLVLTSFSKETLNDPRQFCLKTLKEQWHQEADYNSLYQEATEVLDNFLDRHKCIVFLI